MNWNELARVSFSEITPQRLERLFELYDQTVGGAATHRLTSYPIDRYVSQLGEVKTMGIIKWRFGSSISRDSKLAFRRDGLSDDLVVVVYFDPNVDEPKISAAESLGKAFNIAVVGFLRGEGLMAE